MQKRFQLLRNRHVVSSFRLALRTKSGERLREGRWSLPDSSTLRLEPRGAALTIRCVRGTSLVTQERDPTDHILQPGGELVTRPRGVVVVWALSESEVAAAEPARGAASRRAGDASPTAAHRTGRTTA